MSLLRHTRGTYEDTKISPREFPNHPQMTQNYYGHYRQNYGYRMLRLAPILVSYTLLHI